MDIKILKGYLNQRAKDFPFMIFGRSGRYPGLDDINIYFLGTAATVHLYSSISEEEKNELISLLKKSLKGIPCSIIDRNSRPYSLLYCSKDMPNPFIFTENGLKFQLDLVRPIHPGLFFDIEPARRRVRDLSNGKRVLNLFAFTCGFSVYAAAGKAESVLNVDNISNVLSRGRENHRLNNQDLKKIYFEKKDIMKNFGLLKRKGPFDLIICDPPTFQKGSFSAEKDYGKLVRRLKDVLSPRGKMLLCLNAPFLRFDFLEHIAEKEGLKIDETINPAEDFRQKDPETGLKIVMVSS